MPEQQVYILYLPLVRHQGQVLRLRYPDSPIQVRTWVQVLQKLDVQFHALLTQCNKPRWNSSDLRLTEIVPRRISYDRRLRGPSKRPTVEEYVRSQRRLHPTSWPEQQR